MQVWQMSLAFGCCQLFLSQMPSLEDAWWSSIIGALMSFMYSTCALALGASKGAAVSMAQRVSCGLHVLRANLVCTQAFWLCVHVRTADG
jgi:hypothetical protein